MTNLSPSHTVNLCKWTEWGGGSFWSVPLCRTLWSVSWNVYKCLHIRKPPFTASPSKTKQNTTIIGFSLREVQAWLLRAGTGLWARCLIVSLPKCIGVTKVHWKWISGNAALARMKLRYVNLLCTVMTIRFALYSLSWQRSPGSQGSCTPCAPSPQACTQKPANVQPALKVAQLSETFTALDFASCTSTRSGPNHYRALSLHIVNNHVIKRFLGW